MTAAVADKETQRKKQTRLGRLLLRVLLPQIDPNSALLPPDKWILRTAYEFVKDNKSFHDTMGRAALYAGGGLGAVVAGTVGAVLLFPLALPMAAAGLAALGAAWFAGKQAKHHFERFKTETLPGVRNELGKKYLEYKMSELKAAWQRNLDERRKKKAETAKKPAPEVKPATPKPEETKPEAKKPDVTPEKQPETHPVAATEKTAPAKPSEKKSLGSAFAELARKMAEERAKKLLKKDGDAPKPPETKAPDIKPEDRKPPQP